jgi:hypothetical protein
MCESAGPALNGRTSPDYPEVTDLHLLLKLTVYHADDRLSHLTVVSC